MQHLKSPPGDVKNDVKRYIELQDHQNGFTPSVNLHNYVLINIFEFITR